MAKNYNLRINRKHYNFINKGTKTIDVRVGYRYIKDIRKGDTITFKDYSNTRFEVIRITRYNDFPDMLDNENPSEIIPGISKYKILEIYQKFYPEDKEALGVYVFELRKESTKMYLCKLSTLIQKNPKLFAKFTQAAYSVTDCQRKDYPDFFKWYWTKQIPRVINGTGEIIICINNKHIAGVAFLKKEATERKICTFLVVEGFRFKHVASQMLKCAFEYLGTTKPLITIADYKAQMFEQIIQKYNWEWTQTMDKGYYNDSSRELVYNGKLTQ